MRPRSSLDRAVAAAFPLLLGGLVWRLVVTGTFRRYVKASMWPWLLLAGTGLLVLAGWELLARRADRAVHRPAVAWLIVAPVVVVLGVAPGALGSSALERSTRPRAVAVTGDGRFAPLPRGSDPVDITVGELVERSYAGDTADGATVRIVGFVAAGEDDATAFRVVRFRISCCAADAQPMAVRILTGGEGDGGTATTRATAPPVDSWVAVTGTLERDEPAVLEPRFRATSIEPISEPASPYESMTSAQ